MATEFKPSVLVSDVFGSAGDVTAVHRDGKTYLRKRRSGTTEMTPSQAAHAQVHSRALAAWRTQPQSVQELWHKLARDVEPHRPPFDHTSWISGQNLFVSAYHGFYTLGKEHVPEPVPFELFPPFALKAVEAIAHGEGLVLRLSLSGLERLRNPERYWLYGQFQLGTPGKGMSSRLPRQSVLASAPCSVMPAEFVVDNYVASWGPSLPAYQVNANLILLDEVTGYRSQKHPVSGVVKLF